MEKTKYFTSKKIIIILLSLAVIFAGLAVIIHFSTKVTNESYEKCILGDVNGDGYINSGDALEVIKMLTGNAELFDSQQKNGDVNADGKLSSADALILLRYCIGDIDDLPYTEKPSENNPTVNNKSMLLENGNFTASAKILNEWKNSDGKTSYQISISAKNSSSEEITDWSVKLTLSDKVEISKKWDCSASVDENTISISGEDIPTSTAVGCGLIVTCENDLSIKNIEME